MPKEKSKGPDGLNVEFYIFFIGKWLETFCLNPSLIFFQTTTIPNSWDKTCVALIQMVFFAG